MFECIRLAFPPDGSLDYMLGAAVVLRVIDDYRFGYLGLDLVGGLDELGDDESSAEVVGLSNLEKQAQWARRLANEGVPKLAGFARDRAEGFLHETAAIRLAAAQSLERAFGVGGASAERRAYVLASATADERRAIAGAIGRPLLDPPGDLADVFRLALLLLLRNHDADVQEYVESPRPISPRALLGKVKDAPLQKVRVLADRLLRLDPSC